MSSKKPSSLPVSAGAAARHAGYLADFQRPKRGNPDAKTARARISAVPPPKKSARTEKAGPTPERLAKGDVVRGKSGQYIAESGLDKLGRAAVQINAALAKDLTKSESVLKRLHRSCSLHSDPGMSEQMYQAGKKYEEVVHLAGLGGIAAQNLMSSGGGGSDPAHMMPATEAAARARQKLRQAWDILPEEMTRALHGMLVEGRDAVSVGREASMYKHDKDCRLAGLMLLRLALGMLVARRWL